MSEPVPGLPMRTRGVRFQEHPWLDASVCPDGSCLVLRPPAVLDQDDQPLVTVLFRPGTLRPEVVGKLVNELRDQGYPVEVLPVEEERS